MKVDVVLTRRLGRRLKGRELPQPAGGDLIVDTSGPAKRPNSLYGRVVITQGNDMSKTAVLAPLVDVQLLALTGGVLRLLGVEHGAERSSDGLFDHPVERLQIWRCRFVHGAQFDVVRLRAQGRRLQRYERAPAVSGQLTIEGGHGLLSSFRREGLTARLCSPRGANGNLVGQLLPLFDVHLVEVGAQSLTVAGIELQVTRAMPAGELLTTESLQVWRCTPRVAPATNPNGVAMSTAEAPEQMLAVNASVLEPSPRPSSPTIVPAPA